MKDPVNSVVGELLDPRNRIAVAEELSRHLLGMSDGTNEGPCVVALIQFVPILHQITSPYSLS